MSKKILVVDDNRVMLSFLDNTLKREGHHVVTAEDGLSALDILTSFTPDIIFLDLILPKIGGDKLCQIIRKIPHLADCYLVILSAAVAEMEHDFGEIGADACIAKGPFGKMAEHVLAAIIEHDAPRDERPGQIVGLNGIYARQMTKELLSRNLHLETTLESISEGILEVYSERVVYANSAAISLFRMPQEKILASYLTDLFDDNLRPKVKSLLKSTDDKPLEIGLNKPLEINDRLVTIKGLPVRNDPFTTIILITDITKRKQLEMRLQHTQKMEAIGTITSGVAHNFRNILAGILVNNQVVEINLEDDSRLRENVERIATSVKNGVQLVEDLMQFTHRHTKTKFQKLNLAKVIHETYQLIKESFYKQIDIRINIPELLPISGDPSALGLALMNICTNARDSMPEGGQLRIEAKQEENMAVVTISDEGTGMGRDTSKKCFDPFFTTKDVGHGTGLGLSTTYGIIKDHEGEISVTSESNKGTVFTILLPLDISEEQDKQEYLTEIVRGNGEKVLVVDDEIEILKAMPDLLESIGYQTAIASNGKDAIDKYKTWQPDAVLMDISMPEMDGFTCIEKIMEYDPGAKAIILSGYEEDGPFGIDEQKKGHIKGFLTKPVGLHELGTSLAQLFK